MKLTNRERVLIWMFINLTFFVLGVGKVVPRVLEQYKQAKEVEDVYINKEIEVKDLLTQKPHFDGWLTEQYELSRSLTEPYFDNILPERLDEWLRNLHLEGDVNFRSLTIGEAKISSISAYQPSEKILDYSVKNYYDKIQSNQSIDTKALAEQAIGDAVETILERSLTISLTGSRESLEKFLDTLTNAKRYIKVNTFTLSDTELKVDFTVYIVEHFK